MDKKPMDMTFDESVQKCLNCKNCTGFICQAEHCADFENFQPKKYTKEMKTENTVVENICRIANGRFVKKEFCELIVAEAPGYPKKFMIEDINQYAFHYEWDEFATWYLSNYYLLPENKDKLYRALWTNTMGQWRDSNSELIEEYEDWEKRFYEERGWNKRKGQGELFDEENF
jgi:hypothetical protein